jgi:cell division protein FtsB
MPETPANPAPTTLKHWWSQSLNNRRRIGTVAAVVFALFLAWHVVNGRNGLTSWQQKRSENKALTQEIDQLTEENGRLSQHVDRLKSDPGAIEHEARARLRYARPNEIIWAISESAPSQASSAASK